jgi:hypothetical protein
MNSPDPYTAPTSSPLQSDSGRPERTLAAWALRYLLVGTAIGLMLPLFVFPSTIPPVFIMPVLGAGIGSAFGCVGGSLERWIKSRARASVTNVEFIPSDVAASHIQWALEHQRRAMEAREVAVRLAGEGKKLARLSPYRVLFVNQISKLRKSARMDESSAASSNTIAKRLMEIASQSK